jgi:hypothetical protein
MFLSPTGNCAPQPVFASASIPPDEGTQGPGKKGGGLSRSTPSPAKGNTDTFHPMMNRLTAEGLGMDQLARDLGEGIDYMIRRRSDSGDGTVSVTFVPIAGATSADLPSVVEGIPINRGFPGDNL